MLRIGVIGSGKGSNFQAIADAVNSGKLKGVEIAVVISDVENSYILERAKKMGIDALYINPGAYKTKLEPEIEQQYVSVFKKYNVGLIVLAGFMRMVKNGLMSAFPQKIINIHPSLLPAFPGLESFKQAFDYGVKVTGCTVHFVDEGMDTGPIIGQKTVPVLDTDTASSVHERIQVQEHILYPECIGLIAQGRVKVSGRKVFIDGDGAPVLNNIL